MNWKELSDRGLVELCLQSMQHEAWAEFLGRFQPQIARVAAKTLRGRSMTPNRDLVDDLVQSVFVKLFDKDCRAMRFFQWQHENSFRGFLQVVTSRVVQDYLRALRPRGKEEALEDVSPEKLVTDRSVKDELKTQIDEIIACLQRLLGAERDCKRDTSIFLLYFWHGCSAREISQLYPLTVKSVENTLLRMVRIAKARCLKQRQGSPA